MDRIEIVKADITTLETDCIVNAANSELLAGGGVCGAIFRAAGYAELTQACEKIGGCPTGGAVITPGFRLKARYIIHAVCPIWNGGQNGEKNLLFSAYTNSLKLARENSCRTIAFPLISAGIYGYPLHDAWETAVEAVSSYQRMNEGSPNVVFAVIDDKILQTGRAILKSIKEH